MSGAIYGGDEVGALVVEVGSFTTKAGYAGEDCPPCIISTAIGTKSGVVPAGTEVTETTDQKRRQYYVGNMGLPVFRPDMEVIHPLKDTEIVDWDAYEALLDHVFEHGLRCNPKEHPVMITDDAWSSRQQREKIAELLLEKYQVPAFYLARKAVLTAFAHGKATAMIFDVGANGCSAVPVYDGYFLQKCVQRSKLGGDVLTNLFQESLAAEKIEIVPRFMIAKKGSREENKQFRKYKLNKLTGITDSYRDYCIGQETQNFIAAMAQVSEMPYDDSKMQGLPTMPYEFSTGYVHNFGSLRLSVPETLFHPEAYTPTAQGKPVIDLQDPLYNVGMGALVQNSIEASDPDLRNTLYSNITVTGGTSQLPGLAERLSYDVSALAPSTAKLTLLRASSNERRFSSWIGGSILASLGTFQQMWLSSQEYQDGGKGEVDKKCP